MVTARNGTGTDVRVLQQQLSHALDAIEAASSHVLQDAQTTPALALAVSQLRQSQIIARLNEAASAHGSDAAITILTKLCTRINSLVGTPITRPDGPGAQLRGYLLANELVEQADFDVWAASASTWAQGAVTLLANASATSSILLLRAVMQLLDAHLLGGAAGQRLDYNRQVVLPNVPKLGAALVRLAELQSELAAKGRDNDFVLDLLGCLTSQLHQFSSIYRPLAARLHDVTIKVLLEDISEPSTFSLVHEHAARLLGALHLTGASNASAARRSGTATSPKSTQAQLWNATVATVLRTMSDAARACTSTFSQSGGVLKVQSGDRLAVDIPAEDDHQQHPSLVATFLRLNAILHVLLSTPTPSSVPIPAASLLTLAIDVLGFGSQPRIKAGSEASLYALQLLDLVPLQQASLSLMAVTAAACQDGVQSYSAPVLGALTTCLQRYTNHGMMRLALLRTLSVVLDSGAFSKSSSVPGADLAIDPGSRMLPRLGQACLTEVAKLMSPPSSHAQDTGHQLNGDAEGSTRKAKRQRVYEGSSLLGQGAERPFVGKTADELYAAAAAVTVFGNVYPHLSSNLRPIHADLSQTGVQLLVATAELLMHGSSVGDVEVGSERELEDARVHLTATTLSTLARILNTGSGRLLSLAASRTWNVFELGRRSQSASIRLAAETGRTTIDQIVHPRIPAVLPLRFATDADIGHESAQWGNEERKLGEAELDDVRGVAERQALEHVLDMVPVSAPSAEARGDAADSVTTPAGLKRTLSSLSQSLGSQDGSHHHASLHQHALPADAPSLANASRASPDPVKPLHRPSTPRIGSPSPTRKAFLERADPLETPSRRVNEVAMLEVSTGDGMEGAGEQAATLGQEETAAGVTGGLTSAASARTPAPGQAGRGHLISTSAVEGDPSDDEEMPEIDLASDDDDDDEEGDAQRVE